MGNTINNDLRSAARKGNLEDVERLLRDSGAEVNSADEYSGVTALILASENGRGSIVDSLIRAGASVDIQNKYGNTALIWASSNRHGSIVDSLIQQHRFLYYNGVDPNPLRRSDVEQLASLFSTSQALCVTTLLADNYVYMDVDSTEELVQMLFAEYYTSDMDP